MFQLTEQLKIGDQTNINETENLLQDVLTGVRKTDKPNYNINVYFTHVHRYFNRFFFRFKLGLDGLPSPAPDFYIVQCPMQCSTTNINTYIILFGVFCGLSGLTVILLGIFFLVYFLRKLQLDRLIKSMKDKHVD
jgi:hypothetical protein